MIHLSYVDVNVYIMHLNNLIYDLCVVFKFLIKIIGYLLWVSRIMEAHWVNFLLKITFYTLKPFMGDGYYIVKHLLKWLSSFFFYR